MVMGMMVMGNHADVVEARRRTDRLEPSRHWCSWAQNATHVAFFWSVTSVLR